MLLLYSPLTTLAYQYHCKCNLRRIFHVKDNDKKIENVLAANLASSYSRIPDSNSNKAKQPRLRQRQQAEAVKGSQTDDWNNYHMHAWHWYSRGQHDATATAYSARWSNGGYQQGGYHQQAGYQYVKPDADHRNSGNTYQYQRSYR